MITTTKEKEEIDVQGDKDKGSSRLSQEEIITMSAGGVGIFLVMVGASYAAYVARTKRNQGKSTHKRNEMNECKNV